MLQISNLNFTINQDELFIDWQMSINFGQVIHIQGANGRGKSSLLKIIAGLIKPQQCKIYFDGYDIYENYQKYCQDLVYLSTETGLNDELTANQHGEFLAQIMGAKPPKLELYHEFKIPINRQIKYLSSGQKRRLMMVECVFMPKKLWLMDETASGLDSDGCELLQNMIHHQRENGGIIIITGHQTLPIHADLIINLG